MRKVVLSVLLIIVILGFIKIAIEKHTQSKGLFDGDVPHHPVSISGGLSFEIPAEQKDKFYIKGFEGDSSDKINTLQDFINNKVSNDTVDSTQVISNGDLISDSGIGYITIALPPEDGSYTLIINGNIDPKKTRAFMRE